MPLTSFVTTLVTSSSTLCTCLSANSMTSSPPPTCTTQHSYQHWTFIIPPNYFLDLLVDISMAQRCIWRPFIIFPQQCQPPKNLYVHQRQHTTLKWWWLYETVWRVSGWCLRVSSSVWMVSDHVWQILGWVDVRKIKHIWIIIMVFIYCIFSRWPPAGQIWVCLRCVWMVSDSFWVVSGRV